MKKVVILSLMLGVGMGAMATPDIPLPIGNLLNDVGTMQNSNAQFKLLEEQKFREEEYNEFQDMKDVKAARNKKVELEDKLNNPERYILNPNQDVGFVRDSSGRMIIKRMY